MDTNVLLSLIWFTLGCKGQMLDESRDSEKGKFNDNRTRFKTTNGMSQTVGQLTSAAEELNLTRRKIQLVKG